jgi:hypothetical protein
VEFAHSVQAHLRALPAGDRAVVLDAIERQLSEVGPDANGPVRILAVSRKRRSVLTIGDEEVRL